MTYGALNTVTLADAEHAGEAISDVSNVFTRAHKRWKMRLEWTHVTEIFFNMRMYILMIQQKY